MTHPQPVDFIAPRGAWLFGHVGGPAGRRRQAVVLGVCALALVAAAAAWLQRPPPAPMTAAPTVARSSPAVVPLPNAAERARVNRVVRRLNTAWGPIFEALENQAGARAALLSLETDADRGAVRVTTEGPSLDELLLHAERVQATAPFVRTKLLRIEPPETAGAVGGAGAPAATPGLTRLSFDLVMQ